VLFVHTFCGQILFYKDAPFSISISFKDRPIYRSSSTKSVLSFGML
jgi:hypothetical protein